MSAIALSISLPGKASQPLAPMQAASDRGMPSPRPWLHFEDKRISLASRQGITDAHHEKTLYQDDKIVVVLDGRIDNRDDLLGELGVGPTSSEAAIPDVEIVAKAFSRFGKDLARRMEGDYCFLIYNKQTSEILVARDALGHRPFYYATVDGALVCASYIRQFEPVLAGRASLDPAYFSEYFTSNFAGFLEGERTPFQEIRRLLPGHCLLIDARTLSVSRARFFDPNDYPIEYRTSFAKTTEAFRRAISLSVERQLRSAGPVGLAVSGGLDSSAVAVLARECGKADLIGYNFVCPESSPLYDESVWLSSLERKLKLPIREVVMHALPASQMRPASMEGVGAFDEPGSGKALEHLRSLYTSLAEDGAHVVMFGHGESISRVFEKSTVGMELYSMLRRLDARSALLTVKRYWRIMTGPYGHSYRPMRRLAIDPKQAEAIRLALDLLDLRHPELICAAADTECWPGSLTYETPQELRYMSIMKPANEPSESQMSLDYGIDTRMPFRSLAALRVVLQTPSYVIPGKVDREILRGAVERLLPEPIKNRPKIAGDIAQQFRFLAQVSAEVMGQGPLEVERRRLVDSNVLRDLMRRMTNGNIKPEHMRCLELALSLEFWLRSHPLVPREAA